MRRVCGPQQCPQRQALSMPPASLQAPGGAPLAAQRRGRAGRRQRADPHARQSCQGGLAHTGCCVHAGPAKHAARRVGPHAGLASSGHASPASLLCVRRHPARLAPAAAAPTAPAGVCGSGGSGAGGRPAGGGGGHEDGAYRWAGGRSWHAESASACAGTAAAVAGQQTNRWGGWVVGGLGPVCAAEQPGGVGVAMAGWADARRPCEPRLACGAHTPVPLPCPDCLPQCAPPALAPWPSCTASRGRRWRMGTCWRWWRPRRRAQAARAARLPPQQHDTSHAAAQAWTRNEIRDCSSAQPRPHNPLSTSRLRLLPEAAAQAWGAALHRSHPPTTHACSPAYTHLPGPLLSAPCPTT